MDTHTLEMVKTKIERMDKKCHIEVLKILKKHPSVKLNENKNGVFVNLSFLPKESIADLCTYIHYIEDQESSLLTVEYQKREYRNAYFVEKDNKDEGLLLQ
jgi:hypothetical protein